MATQSDRLAILSDTEQFALYGLPDFDDGQRLEYLSLCEAELALAGSRPSLLAPCPLRRRKSAYYLVMDSLQSPVGRSCLEGYGSKWSFGPDRRQ
jgi:hypothetical protein